MSDTLEKLRKKYNVVPTDDDPVDAETGLTLSEKARLSSAGLLMNFSDEVLAATRALFGEDYDEAVADERAKLEGAREKEGSLKYEIGGAVVPAVAAAPFTGGASVPLTMGRLATIGGAQAFGSAVGAREGDFIDRVTEDPAALATETAVGVVAGPTVSKGVKYGGKALKGILSPGGSFARFLTGKISRPVETEIRRIAEDSGIKYEDIVERIGKGEIFPDLSPQAAKDVAGLYTSSGRGGQAIADVVVRRADELPTEARATLQADLSPDSITGNITKFFNKKIKDIQDAESDSYKKIFAKGISPSNSLNLAVQELLQGQKFLRNKVNTLMSTNKKPPLFKVVEGQVELLDDVDLETAEIVRRSLKDKTDASFRTGEGSLGTAVANLEDELRTIIDKVSPELAKTRAGWAKVSKMKDIFDEGKKVLNKSSEEAEILMDGILGSGDDELINSFRSGVAFRLKTQAEKPAGRTSQIKNLADEKSGMRIILERLYPGDSVEEAFNKIKLANKALETQTKVIGGSPTAGRLEAVKRQGSAGDIIADTADVALTGNITAPVLRFVRRTLGKNSGLTADQLEQVSKIIITEDPDIMQKALIDPQIQQLLVSRINAFANLVQMGAGGAGAYGAGEVARESGASGVVDSLVKAMSSSTKEKVKALQQ